MKDYYEFWNKINVLTEDECWLWSGYSECGYGRVRWYGKMIGAHILAFKLFKGDACGRKIIRHTCFNSMCCNPKHLVCGTRQENNRDADVTNLSVEKVAIIRKLASLGVKYSIIAEVFETTKNNISHIFREVIWK